MMMLPLLVSLIVLNHIKAKHFLVEAEDKEEEIKTERQVSAGFDVPKEANAKKQYKSLSEEAQKVIERKLYEKYGDDVKEVRYI